MKRRFWFILAVMIGLSIVSCSAVQKEQKSHEEQFKETYDDLVEKTKNLRPPGVSIENWIALSANAGIVLKSRTRMPGSNASAYTGILMFKTSPTGPWQALIIDNPM